MLNKLAKTRPSIASNQKYIQEGNQLIALHIKKNVRNLTKSLGKSLLFQLYLINDRGGIITDQKKVPFRYGNMPKQSKLIKVDVITVGKSKFQ